MDGPHIEQLLIPQTAAMQVVDVGGGTGFCTQGIVQSVKPTNVTLIDQSPHQLEKARKKADLQGVSIVEASDCTACPNTPCRHGPQHFRTLSRALHGAF